MFYIILLLLIVFLIWLYFKFVKMPKLNSLNFIDGGLGTGKSFLTVSWSVRAYRKRLRRFNFVQILLAYKLVPFDKLKSKLEKIELPLLYSNIPLDTDKLKLRYFNRNLKKFVNVGYVPFCKDLMTRQIRFNYKSVLLLDELSNLVDQMDFRDKNVNQHLTEFFKLFRHETKGGLCFINSQSTSDLHYSLKYCLNQYYYIHSKTRLLFGSLLRIRECSYTADNNTLNVNTDDIETPLKVYWVPNKFFKYYDTYCHSWLTDNIERKCESVSSKRNVGKGLKSWFLWTFKELSFLFEHIKEKKGEKEKNEKKDS